jgi:hypothetical protein
MKENESIMVLKALGAEETTSRTQKKNGTSEWTLSTGEVVTEHSNGYVIKKTFWRGKVEGCYQLNPVRKEKETIFLDPSGQYECINHIRIMIPTRAERLERLLKFAARKLNKIK